MLALEEVQASYGASPVLFGLSLTVAPGQAVALLGRNGMGKTTTIRTITGALRLSGGRITFGATRLDGLAGHRICRLGIGYVPEGRRIFRHLTVQEQLASFAHAGPGPAWRVADIYDLFPGLVPRRRSPGGLLSGGEQQMLAIGRALMTGPSLLILDEATEGLAPLIRARIWEVLQALKGRGLSVLVVDKNLDEVLSLADRIFVLEKGRIVWQGDAPALRADATARQRFLAV